MLSRCKQCGDVCQRQQTVIFFSHRQQLNEVERPEKVRSLANRDLKFFFFSQMIFKSN